MNRRDWDILLALRAKPYTTQRELREDTGYSLGNRMRPVTDATFSLAAPLMASINQRLSISM